MQQTAVMNPLTEETFRALENFTKWLEDFGETSLDHQTFFAGPVGRFAKSIYYTHPRLGIGAV